MKGGFVRLFEGESFEERMEYYSVVKLSALKLAKGIPGESKFGSRK